MALPSLARADDSPDEMIRDFDCDMIVRKNGHLDVTETILMDFASDQRHGLRRFIPTRYVFDDKPYTVNLRLLGTTCDGIAARCDTTYTDDDTVLRIGDPDRTMSGQHKYVIHYEVAHAILFARGQPRIYWNATGNQWPYRILHASAEIHLPDNVDTGALSVSGFRGVAGATDQVTLTKAEHELLFETDGLNASEGLTVSAYLPPGSIVVPPFDAFFWWFHDWWPLLVLPPAAFFLMLSRYLACGRDPANAHIAGVDWNPPKELSPAEVGTLVDERCDASDIVSTLVDLAARGYLVIHEMKASGFLFSSKDYQLVCLHPEKPLGVLKPYEITFLNGIFERGDTVLLSSLKEKFYVHIAEIKKDIYARLADGKYFQQNPEQCRSSYIAIGVLTAFAGCFLAAAMSGPMTFALVLTGIIICLWSQAMPARTEKGVEATRQCLGFKRFVMKAEKDRIRVLAKDDPTIFGRLLPYAMVLGAAEQWALAFHDLLTEAPDWYVSSSVNSGFSSSDFVNSLGDGMRTCASTLSSSPSSSSGGGSSGGGCGGGGGGSW